MKTIDRIFLVFLLIAMTLDFIIISHAIDRLEQRIMDQSHMIGIIDGKLTR